MPNSRYNEANGERTEEKRLLNRFADQIKLKWIHVVFYSCKIKMKQMENPLPTHQCIQDVSPLFGNASGRFESLLRCSELKVLIGCLTLTSPVNQTSTSVNTWGGFWLDGQWQSHCGPARIHNVQKYEHGNDGFKFVRMWFGSWISEELHMCRNTLICGVCMYMYLSWRYSQDHHHGCLHDGPASVPAGRTKLHPGNRELWVTWHCMMSDT